MERTANGNANLLAAHAAVELAFDKMRLRTPLEYMTHRHTLTAAVMMFTEEELLTAHKTVKLMRDHEMAVTDRGFNLAVSYAKQILEGAGIAALPVGVENVRGA